MRGSIFFKKNVPIAVNTFDSEHVTLDENEASETAVSLGLMKIYDLRCEVCGYVLIVESE